MKLWVDDIRRPPSMVCPLCNGKSVVEEIYAGELHEVGCSKCDRRGGISDPDWLWARTNDEAKLIFQNYEITEASLDHDLGLHLEDPDEEDADLRIHPERWKFEDGYHLVSWMIEHKHLPRRCVVHSWNPPGAQRMVAALRTAGVKAVARPYER